MTSANDAMAKTYIAALNWYTDQGVDESMDDAPRDYRKQNAPTPDIVPKVETPPRLNETQPDVDFLGRTEMTEHAVQAAQTAQTLDELREAIAAFEGLAIKKTATNMVFCDGNPKAPVMLVGEAPGADEDREGKPFVGVSGQLLDKMLAAIGLDRKNEDPAQSIYIANILNWRPPGNRTPSPAEVAVSLPFIERHIALVKPKLLILCGGVSAKALLGRDEGVSKLRGKWHAYKSLTLPEKSGIFAVQAIATYHPSYLLRTPQQKRAAWQDLLMIKELISKGF